MNKRVETTALIFVTEYQNCLGKKRIEKNRIFEKFLILRLFQRIWIVIEAYFPLKFGAIFKGKIKLLKKLAQHSLELCHHTFIKQHAAFIFSIFFLGIAERKKKVNLVCGRTFTKTTSYRSIFTDPISWQRRAMTGTSKSGAWKLAMSPVCWMPTTTAPICARSQWFHWSWSNEYQGITQVGQVEKLRVPMKEKLTNAEKGVNDWISAEVSFVGFRYLVSIFIAGVTSHPVLVLKTDRT